MTADEAMKQAADTAQFYMVRAVEEIDSKFGVGFAQHNPELIAAFMKVAAADFQSSVNLGIIE